MAPAGDSGPKPCLALTPTLLARARAERGNRTSRDLFSRLPLPHGEDAGGGSLGNFFPETRPLRQIFLVAPPPLIIGQGGNNTLLVMGCADRPFRIFSILFMIFQIFFHEFFFSFFLIFFFPSIHPCQASLSAPPPHPHTYPRRPTLECRGTFLFPGPGTQSPS